MYFIHFAKSVCDKQLNIPKLNGHVHRNTSTYTLSQEISKVNDDMNPKYLFNQPHCYPNCVDHILTVKFATWEMSMPC